MELVEPIHQRIDLLSKVVGVIFVAIGIDQFRNGNSNAAMSYILLGGLVSITPFFIDVKK
ncbi:MAG: hypothetical protein ACE5HH_02675 [Candidatus Hydrothermarchaeales archaeon]